MMPDGQAPSPDSIRSVLHGVFAQPAFHWVTRPDALHSVRAWLLAAVEWLGRFASDNPVLFRVVFWALAAIVLLILLRTTWEFSRSFRRSLPALTDTDTSASVRDASWYRAEANRLMQTGRFAEAMQADFLALVLALDTQRLLRFHPSKTPSEYVTEVQLAPAARREFRAMVGTLYRVVFGGATLDEADFLSWRANTWPEHYAPAE